MAYVDPVYAASLLGIPVSDLRYPKDTDPWPIWSLCNKQYRITEHAESRKKRR